MFQADTAQVEKIVLVQAARPVIRLEERLNVLRYSTPEQLAQDKAEYAATEMALRTQSPAKYPPNANFIKIGAYSSVMNPAFLPKSEIDEDALELFRYEKYLQATQSDWKTGAAEQLYGSGACAMVSIILNK